ncbi:MAG: CPBP family intramembrane glutamic endopeptidase [Pyrinomonadaceae bacterium]
MENIEQNLGYEPMNPRDKQFEAVGPTPDNPPWNSWVAVGIWILSVFLIVTVPSLFLLPYAMSQVPPITETPALVEFAKNDPTAIILQILAIIPAHILTLLIAWLVVTRFRTYSFRETLGWKSGGMVWWHYAAILISFAAVAVVVGSISPEQENDLIRMLRSSRSAVYIVAFLATFTAPIVEEVIYRGVLYSAFQRKVGVSGAFMIVTLMFAIVHVPQYYPSYSTIFLLGLLSVILTAMRVWSKNLLPCIILHTLFNGIQSIFLILGTMSGDLDMPPDPGVLVQFLK